MEVTSSEIPVVLCADAHCVAGIVMGKGQRLLETLNDPSSQYLKVANASLQSSQEATGSERMAEVTLAKSQLTACLLIGETHEAPVRRRYAHVEKQKHRATVLADGYVIAGSLNIKGAADAIGLLEREFGTFFPMTEVQLRHPTSNRSFSVSVALINKSRVSLLQVSDAAV